MSNAKDIDPLPFQQIRNWSQSGFKSLLRSAEKANKTVISTVYSGPCHYHVQYDGLLPGGESLEPFCRPTMSRIEISTLTILRLYKVP